MSKTFCPIPWIHLAVRNNGTMRMCCQANQGPNKGLLRSGEHVFNAGVDELKQARNSELLKQVRVDMLAGRWNPECKRCQVEEESGILSRRSYEKELWAETVTFEQAREMTGAKGDLDPEQMPVAYFDLRFGNKCNLKCWPCGPADSSSWYEDHYQMWGDHYTDSERTIHLSRDAQGRLRADPDVYNWYESDRFWSQMEKSMPAIRHIYLVGGEPLLIEEHYRFLNQCIERGYAAHMVIEYNTNGTILPDKVFEIWKHFRQVRIGVSIDGVGEVNEFIRFPSKWSVVERNLQRLDESPANVVVWFAHTVMALNISQLPEFIIWRVQKNFKKINLQPTRAVMADHPVHSPRFLNMKILPLETKKRIVQKFESQKSRIHKAIESSSYQIEFKESLWSHSEKLLAQYQKFLFQEDRSAEYSKFQSNFSTLNRIRGQSVPECLVPYL